MEVKPIEGEVTEEILNRFRSKVKYNAKTKCHEWTAAVRGGYDKQYGVFKFGNRTVYAHRFALYVVLGKDPGPSVDHLCHNPKCVNVEHLRGGSIADNNANRRVVISEYCRQGHLRLPENVYVNPTTGRRRCRECDRILDQKRSKRKYEAYKKTVTHSSEMRDFKAKPKLTKEQVEEIRSKYAEGNTSQRKLAREYQVSQPMIGFIVRGEWWQEQ